MSLDPKLVMQAHQYLYYVKSRPVWSDYDYDRFCKANGLEDNGGSDLESDYSKEVKALAGYMAANPLMFAPERPWH